MSINVDVKTSLDLGIDMYDLDAGYAREELFKLFNRNNSFYIDENNVKRDHTVLVRMPATKGYPHDELYFRVKQHIHDPDNMFAYEEHTYFGERFEVDIFNNPMYAFVFVDKTQAESLLRGWLEDHLDEWEDLSHPSKEWLQVKNGFFILLGNKDQSPFEAIVEYRGRAHIETFFRDGKAYLRILPISKWTKETITGKIFHDVLQMIFYRCYRKSVANTHLPMSKLIVRMNSWQCIRTGKTTLETWPPKKQVRETMEKLGYAALSLYDIEEMREEILEGIPMKRELVKKKNSRSSGKFRKPPLSPEEKKIAAEEAKAAKKQAAEEAKAAKKQAIEEAGGSKKTS